MSKIVVLIETNGNWYLQDGTGKVLEADKNALIKELAARIGVSILTSDEVNFIKDNNNNLSIAMDNKTKESLENTDWDTENVTHDGIQFNKHFIDLKLKVDNLEAEMNKYLEELKELIIKIKEKQKTI